MQQGGIEAATILWVSSRSGLVRFDRAKINSSWLIWQLICREEKWFLRQVEGGPVKNTDWNVG